MATTEERITEAVQTRESLRAFFLEELAENRQDVPLAAREELVDYVMSLVPDDVHSRMMVLKGWAAAHESYLATLN